MGRGLARRLVLTRRNDSHSSSLQGLGAHSASLHGIRGCPQAGLVNRNVQMWARVKPEGVRAPVPTDHEELLKELDACGVSIGTESLAQK